MEDEQIVKLLDTLDAQSPPTSSERRTIRYPYRVKALLVHMQQPGSTITVPYLVPTRNISENGLSFLHGGFVHLGTRCMAQLITTYGTWDDVTGTVVYARYIEGNIHEVGLNFDRQVDPSIYCTAAVNTRVLLAEDDPGTVRLAKFHLEQLNAQVDTAENGQVAIDKATQSAYDIILMDMEMPVVNGFEAVKRLRTNGYTGTIIAATALTQPGDKERCIEAGCDRYIAKPYKRTELDMLLQSLREEPLFSTLYNDPSMVEMINAFVNDLSSKARDIEHALADNDTQRLETLARCLKGEGSGYGFDVITDAAAQVESSLIRGVPLEQLKSEVKSLAKLCTQARAPSESSGKAPRGN